MLTSRPLRSEILKLKGARAGDTALEEAEVNFSNIPHPGSEERSEKSTTHQLLSTSQFGNLIFNLQKVLGLLGLLSSRNMPMTKALFLSFLYSEISLILLEF